VKKLEAPNIDQYKTDITAEEEEIIIAVVVVQFHRGTL
jgi:hypothetical protein